MPIIFGTPAEIPETIQLSGGWDTLSSPLITPPGIIRDSQNFEIVPTPNGGYARTGGYERYDGRASPSSATFSIIQVASFVSTVQINDVVVGNTSGAGGDVIALGVNYIVVTNLTGSFLDTEVIKVGVTTVGTAVPLSAQISAMTNAQYLALAADWYRDKIEEVPGVGPVQGVFKANLTGTPTVYAFRSEGLATNLFKATGTGWVQIPFYYEVSFTAGGTAIPADGATLTKGGVTATIKRVMLQSGEWADSDAAGRFIITAPTGGNFSAGAATIGGVNVTISGIQTQITMAPGGIFEFDLGNFKGYSFRKRAYGCDGVNRGFEFDGDVLAPITTGTTPDAPKHVKVHKNHLFFSFLSSMIHSGIGKPYKWTADDGSLEINCKEEITNFITQQGTESTAVLGAITDTNTHFLYGTSAANWNLISYDNGIGGAHYTARLLEQGYWFSSNGVVNVRTSQAFGDFTQSSMTPRIPQFILSQRAKGMFGLVNKTRHQYRVIFNDGLALYTTIVNGKSLGSTKMQFPDAFTCGWCGDESNLVEETFVGASTTGYVYQMDIGSSFDGQILDAYFTLNPNIMRSHRTNKKFSAASVEIVGNFYATFQFGYTLSNGSALVLQPSTVMYETNFSGAPVWDSFVWDNFQWDGSTLSPTETDVRGKGTNITPTIRVGTNYIQPFTISTMTFHYTKLKNIKKQGR